MKSVGWRAVARAPGSFWMSRGRPPGALGPPSGRRRACHAHTRAPSAGGREQARFAPADRVVALVSAFRAHGHRIAQLDPLGLGDADLDSSVPPELELSAYFRQSEHALQVPPGMITGGLAAGASALTVQQLVERLREVYSSTVGIEISHLDSRAQREWLQERLEAPAALEGAELVQALEKLAWASSLESFLGKTFPNVKRFGLEGCESLVVGLDALLTHAAQLGVEHVAMGMPHRGRLNVLANVLHKPLEQILCEFRGSGVGTPADLARLRERSDAIFARFDADGSGELELIELQAALEIIGIQASLDEVMTTMEEFDVDGTCTLSKGEFYDLAVTLLSRSFSGDQKYHLGTTSRRTCSVTGAELTVQLLPNPSHLEAVNPLVVGTTRARQQDMGDNLRRKCVALLLHGDAAFAGQGVVFETLGLSDLHAYTTGRNSFAITPFNDTLQ
jgi:2-oxoglutarate dehydrogenase complex dehydrogenase (E1) component-like enzyme